MNQSILKEVMTAAAETIAEDLNMTVAEFEAMLIEQGPESVAMKNFSKVVAKSCEILEKK